MSIPPDQTEDLKRALRRWKRLAITALATLGVMLLFAAGLAVYRTIAVQRERVLAEQARLEAQRQQQKAQDQLHQGAKHADRQ